LLGRSDPPLTDRGREQAAALAARVSQFHPRSIVSSPLRRARDTAAAIADTCGLDVEIDDRLIEIDYGEWECRPLAELPADAVRRWRADAGFAPPGGESLRHVGERVRAFCNETVEDEVVAAVSHVSPIKAAACWALGADDLYAWRLHLDVASLTAIRRPPDGLMWFNGTAHLYG
jgi:probable phosphoglycerate mutase